MSRSASGGYDVRFLFRCQDQKRQNSADCQHQKGSSAPAESPDFDGKGLSHLVANALLFGIMIFLFFFFFYGSIDDYIAKIKHSFDLFFCLVSLLLLLQDIHPTCPVVGRTYRHSYPFSIA